MKKMLILALCLMTLLSGCKKDEPEVIDPDVPPVVTPDKPEPKPEVKPEPEVRPEPKPETPKYKRPDSQPGLSWSLEVPNLEPLNKDRDIYGVEFTLLEDKDGFVVEPGMGDIDKITGIRLYPDKIEVYLNGAFQVLYPDTIGACVSINRPDKDSYPEELAEKWSLTQAENEEGEHVITVEFSKKYEGTLYNLFFTFGKLD